MFENIIHLWEGSGGGQLCTSLIYSTKKSLMLENWNTVGPLWHVDSCLLQLKNDKLLQISLSTVVTGRPIPPKYFENIFKTNDSVGVTRQQT